MTKETLEAARRTLGFRAEAANVSSPARVGYRFTHNGTAGENVDASFQPFLLMRDHGKGGYEIDMMFPQELKGPMTVWGTDEGGAHLLTGMVRALRPLVCLETGTNKGRSARAIAGGLERNQQGHLWTADMFDHNVFQTGAIPDSLQPFVTTVIGALPDCFSEAPLCNLKGIDFAFVDAGHTGEELAADLAFIESHRAEECVVLVDNARDESWLEIAEFFETYTDHPHINIDTMCGMEIIQMRG